MPPRELPRPVDPPPPVMSTGPKPFVHPSLGVARLREHWEPPADFGTQGWSAGLPRHLREPHAIPVQPVTDDPHESLAMALVGAAAVVGFAVALFAILWAL